MTEKEQKINDNTSLQSDLTSLIPPSDRWKFFWKNVGIHLLYVMTVYILMFVIFPKFAYTYLRDDLLFSSFNYYIHFIVPLMMIIYTAFQWCILHNYGIPVKWITHSIYASLLAFLVSIPVLYSTPHYSSVKYPIFTNYSMAVLLFLTVSAVCFVQSLLLLKMGVIESQKWIVYIMILFLFLTDSLIHKNFDLLLQYQLPEWLASSLFYFLVLLVFVCLQSIIIFYLKKDSKIKSEIQLNFKYTVITLIICFSIMYIINCGLEEKMSLFFKYIKLEDFYGTT